VPVERHEKGLFLLLCNDYEIKVMSPYNGASTCVGAAIVDPSREPTSSPGRAQIAVPGSADAAAGVAGAASATPPASPNKAAAAASGSRIRAVFLFISSLSG
jgi:hypothetical protein